MAAIARVFFFLALLFVTVASPALAQYQLSVGNAASGSPVIVPGSLVRLSVFAIGGREIPTDISARLVPAGASPVPVEFVSQNVFLAPKDLPVGSVSVIASSQGIDLATGTFPVIASDPGVFANGINARVPPFSTTNSARPGDFVTLWATGLGTASSVAVLLGGHSAPVTYAGPAPGSPGLDQINFQVPADSAIPDGCLVAVSIQADGRYSNVAGIPKAFAGGACKTPYGFSADTIPLKVGIFSISSSIQRPQTQNGPLPGFTRVEAATAAPFYASGQSLGVFDQPLFAEDVFYSCSYTDRGLSGALFSVPAPDIGGPFTLTGPSGSTPLTALGLSGFYFTNIPEAPVVADPSALAPPFFAAGSWQLMGTRPTSKVPFTANFTLPSPILATNLSPAAAIDRSRDQTVTWNPGSYGLTDTVQATLYGPSLQWFSSGSVSCRVPAQTGKLTLPADLLQKLPPGDGTVQLFASQRPDSPITFSLEPNLPAAIQYTSRQVIPVHIQ